MLCLVSGSRMSYVSVSLSTDTRSRMKNWRRGNNIGDLLVARNTARLGAPGFGSESLALEDSGACAPGRPRLPRLGPSRPARLSETAHNRVAVDRASQDRLCHADLPHTAHAALR